MNTSEKTEKILPAKVEASPLMPADSAGITQWMQAAIENNMVDAIEKLVALQERAEDRAAERQFNAALHRFQMECPPIRKTKTVGDASRGGNKLHYSYAPLDEISLTIREPLHNNGFTYTWDSEETDGRVIARCTLRHNAGHSSTATFSSPVGGTRAMSGSQQSSAALTVAKRQSLVQVLGLTQVDKDTDNSMIGVGERIDDGQLSDLQLALENVGADVEKFCKMFRVGCLSDMAAIDFSRAMKWIELRKENER
ncbi:MAG: ERF family protein [Nannocystaceae bacterium]